MLRKKKKSLEKKKTNCTIILCLAFRNLNLFQNTKNEVIRLACKAIELGI
jgi:hypothetical protein